jgi:ABC-2 type transport system ATP-binding protein
MEQDRIAAGSDGQGPALELVGLLRPDGGRARIFGYSAGMRKKITLATALLHTPRLLVLDEPFEAIDPVSAATIRAILQCFVAAGGSAEAIRRRPTERRP